ncbi:MAG: hypothetical protein ACOX9C_00730 [Kiritimatiellia bacterium]|jgi:5-methylcytosine-specific restriction protein A
MKFGHVQAEKFNTSKGAYSLVTEREEHDSQITATGEEASILEEYSTSKNDSIAVGNVKSDPTKASKAFKLYPSGKTVSLNLVFPKPKKSELRLYISKSAGFKPRAGMVWFLYVDEGNDIWIGSMTEPEWRRQSSVSREGDFSMASDGTIVMEPPPTPAVASVQVWTRKRKLALKRMKESEYCCEYDNDHKLFMARSTLKPFVEPHHVIPIRFQPHFKKTLDALSNLCCLCPHCHRAIHHAEESCARVILKRIAERRDILKNFGLATEELFQLYGVEEISSANS